MSGWLPIVATSTMNQATGEHSLADVAIHQDDDQMICARTRSKARYLNVFVGASIGGAFFGAVTALERIIFHGYMYTSLRDAAQHASAALLASSVGALMVCPVLWFGIRTLKLLVGLSDWRASSLAGALTGAVSGAFLFWYLLAFTNYGRRIPLVLGCLLSGLLFSLAGAVVVPLFERLVHAWYRMTLAASALGVLGATYFALHGHHRNYVNANATIEIGLLALAGFVGAKVLLNAEMRQLRKLEIGVVATWIGCVAIILLTPSTSGARIAMLRHGAFVRTVVRQVYWPLTRKTPAHPPPATSSDAICIDGMPRVSGNANGASELKVSCRQPTELNDRIGAGQGDAYQPQSVVWVIVDTVRQDVTQPHLGMFRGFTNLQNYRACGSNTYAALTQLVGRRGCRPAAPRGPIVAELKRYGQHQTAHFSAVPVKLSDQDAADVYGDFHERVFVPDDATALAKVLEWIAQRELEHQRYFALVHLQGGHNYGREGSSAWERYSNSVRSELASVSQFATKVPASTAVFVLSDHGEEFGEHDGEHHALTLYEEVLKVPLLVRGSAIADRAQSCRLDCAIMVSLIYHTALGIDYSPADCHLSSRGRFASLEYPATYPLESRHMRALELPNRMKVIWDLELDIWELYDLSRDPLERTNLADLRPTELEAARRELYRANAACSP